MKKILIIDDDRLTARIFQSLLQKAGYIVQVALGGHSGLHEFQTLKPDAVLLDAIMPDVSGIDVLARIRELDPDHRVPIIMCTNAPIPKLVDQAKNGGADAVLSKSDIDGLRLREAFRTALEQRAKGPGLSPGIE